jgi:hypothetical protein
MFVFFDQHPPVVSVNNRIVGFPDDYWKNETIFVQRSRKNQQVWSQNVIAVPIAFT